MDATNSKKTVTTNDTHETPASTSKLQRARERAAYYATVLSEVACSFAKGTATFEDLADAAKKNTNAAHEVGRALKGSK